MSELLNRVLFTIGDTQTTLGSFLMVAVIVVATLLAGRLAYRLVRHRLVRKHKTDEEGSWVYGMVAQMLIWFIGLDLALHLLGIHLNSILAASGFLAVGAGFAARNIIENFLSGLILLWDKTIRPGDIVIVSGNWRVIKRIHFRATEATTFEGVNVLIPNSLITQSPVENLTRTDRTYRIDFQVGVSHESDLAVVKKTLEEIVDKLEWKLEEKNKRSWVSLVEFGDSSVDYRVTVWIDDVYDCISRRADLMEAIWWAFKEKDITIAYPQMDVHVDRSDVETNRHKNQ
jgi:small-conductance mechanosensitive channel